MAIIAISGKKTSGKDTVGKIIQELCLGHSSEEVVQSFNNGFGITEQRQDSNWKIKKFADKLKDIVTPSIKYSNLPIRKLTPRLLLQLLGTECGRNIIHPNIWVNALFSKYNNTWRALDIIDMSNNSVKRVSEIPESNWIITDMRFPNEVEAVAVRNGLLFRVESKRCSNEDKHLSETALDNFQGFDEIIQNDGTILELIQKVREILIKHNIV